MATAIRTRSPRRSSTTRSPGTRTTARPPSLGAWTEHAISTTAIGAWSVFAGDVDGDGDTDMLSASYGANKIDWYENDGTPSVDAWAEHSISTTANVAYSVVA